MEQFESKFNFRFEAEAAMRAAAAEGADGSSSVPPSMRGLLGNPEDGGGGGGVRFGGLEIRSYSRSDAPGTLRRKDESRKTERADRKARKAAERAKKEEELRRLRNLKEGELRRKLGEIERMSGGAGLALADLDGDFDPDKFDAAMARAFGEVRGRWWWAVVWLRTGCRDGRVCLTGTAGQRAAGILLLVFFLNQQIKLTTPFCPLHRPFEGLL